MKRREFLSASGAAASGALFGADLLHAEEKTDSAEGRNYIRIDYFWANDGEARKKIIEKIDRDWIPTLNDYGFPKVGVFTINSDLHADDKNYDPAYDQLVLTLVGSPRFEAFRDFYPTIIKKTAMEKYLNQTTADEIYGKRDSEFLYAFPYWPKIDSPVSGPDRVVQFRRYYSPNADRNDAKRRMFDVRGEIDLFRRCGLAPVFFGEMVFGQSLPNIAYMVAFPNDDARKEAWNKFVKSDEWKKMSSEPEFKDTATKIRNLFLRPSPSSQI